MHGACYSKETLEKLVGLFLKNCERFVKGEALENVVNLKLGY